MIGIGKAADLSGVTVETIRYYERENIVPSPERTPTGRRRYDRQAVTRLRFVKRCRDLGFPISDIRALLSLAASPRVRCSDIRRIGEKNLAQVREKIARLRRMEADLEKLVSQCGPRDRECPMLNDLFSD